MNANHITALLEVRSQLLSLRDLEHNPDTGPIESVLRDVPPGVDNRIDLALGRTCAVLPPRVEYNISREVSEVDRLIETTRKIWRETEAIEYQ